MADEDRMEEGRRKLRPLIVDFDERIIEAARKLTPDAKMTEYDLQMEQRVGGWNPEETRDLATELQLTYEAWLECKEETEKPTQH